MKHALLGVVLALACVASSLAQTAPAGAPGHALEPPSSGGLVALDRTLRRLATHRRLLVVAAHPDDEDTTLLTLVSRAMGGEAAYLSVTRGDGGQNLIGPDLGVPLGLIRTQELLAARRLDGARQFFTRAYDFGYTRSIEETFSLWPKEALLEDSVRVIRRFRPQVVVSVFSGASRDGHGQHQAAGIVAREAFRAAGDPALFPELAREGLTPWQPAALYRSTRFDRDTPSLSIPTGAIDPLTGRSYHQIAMASRSLHRSQDFGMLQQGGPNETRVAWLEGSAKPEGNDVFAGIDTRLEAIAAQVADPGRRTAIAERLRRVEALVSRTRAGLTPTTLASAAPPLATVLSDLRAARETLAGDGAEASVAPLLDEKIALAGTALATAAGVSVDALVDRETAAPGETLEVKVNVWNAGTQPLTVEKVELASPDGWTLAGETAAARDVAPGTAGEWALGASPAGDAPTLPYFLRRPLRGAIYDWSDAPAAVKGEPFQPAALAAIVRLRVAGTTVELRRDAVYRFRDQAYGEIRRPVRAVPRLEVSVDPELIVWPAAQKGVRRLEVTLTSNASAPLSGGLEVAPPPGWPAIPPQAFSLTGRGDRRFLEIRLKPQQPFTTGRGRFTLAAVLDDGSRQSASVRVLDYPHIPPTPLPEDAAAEVSTADIRLPPIRRVGYIRGAADRVPEALSAIGVPLDVLAARDVQSGDFTRYDVIVVGSRAYETDPALTASNGRLLDFAGNGGLVIVQYQQYPFIDGNFAPYKLEIARPHDRVTDESAPVRVLDPESPVFRMPNRITESDWSGWVQERGLYFAGKWDPAYTPLLAMADPGQPEKQGSLLVARVGKGLYVYTGLAFFRQLPAGVPGAYRLFANLLAMKPVPVEKSQRAPAR